MRRSALLFCVAMSAWLAPLGSASNVLFAADGKQPPLSEVTRSPEKARNPAEQDLEEMQGVWFYEYANPAGAKMRVEKKVDGTNDIVTEYDALGNIVHAHASTFELKRHGPLRVFTIVQSVVTAGPKMGMKRPGNRSYVYRIEGDRFIEAWGLLEEDRGPPHIILWKKQQPAAP